MPKFDEPAFPVAVSRGVLGNSFIGSPHPGLTISDWFAGQALTGATVSCLNAEAAARHAFAIADAMMVERKIYRDKNKKGA